MFFSYNEIVSGFSCDYAECTCMDDMITCIDVTAPRFKYRAIVTMLYMDNVQVINLIEIIKNVSNLQYLSVIHMRYFNCKWLSELPKQIYVKTNMCLNFSTSSQNIALQSSTTGKSATEMREIKDKVSKVITDKIDKISTSTGVSNMLSRSNEESSIENSTY